LDIKLNERARVLYNKKTACGAYRLGLGFRAEGIAAGHFFMIRSADSIDPLLNRPLGAYRVLDSEGKVIEAKSGERSFSGEGVEFLYNVVGRGTALLAGLKAGDTTSLLGPIGNGFPIPADPTKKIIMVGGGMGIVPFYMLAEATGGGVFLFGARGEADAGLTADFAGLGCGIKIATEDGSVGKKGLVTDLLADELRADAIVYACGPPGMLKAVSAMTNELGARCYVSLEKTMACGIGVCLGCAVKTGHGEKAAYRMVCSDGPVFDSVDIDWDDI